MKNNRFLKFFKNPPALFLCAVWFFTLCFIAGAISVIALGYSGWPSYILFALAAIGLFYSIYAAVRFLPSVKRKIILRARAHPFWDNMLGNYGFRTLAFFILSFIINMAFALFNGVLGIVASSVWYGIFAVYYIALSALRGGILFAYYKAKKRAQSEDALAVCKIKIYRLCGIALLVLELALAAAVSVMVVGDNPVKYSQIMAIAAAAYTFYKVILAIVNAAKVRRMHDFVLQSLRNINLTDAAVSLLALQVTLVAVFSEGDVSFSTAMNASMGFAVCAVTIGLGILMIVRACLQLKKLNEGNINVR